MAGRPRIRHLTVARLRADWFLSEIESAQPIVDVEAMGLEIDLRESAETLHDKLASTVRRESRLYNAGLYCELKMDGQCCHTCPKFTDSPTEARAALCAIGMRQEDLVRSIEMTSERTSELVELAEATGVAEAIELAEACA